MYNLASFLNSLLAPALLFTFGAIAAEVGVDEVAGRKSADVPLWGDGDDEANI
jgi:hypothetical protein